VPSPDSNVQILNRLTPDRRASLIWEIFNKFRWVRKFVTAIVSAETADLSSRAEFRKFRGTFFRRPELWAVNLGVGVD